RDGFEKYCQEFHAKSLIIPKITEEHFTQGDAYITLNRYDIDDVNLIKFAHKLNFQLGKDIGLISYNDLYVKEVLEEALRSSAPTSRAWAKKPPTSLPKIGSPASKAQAN